VFGLIEEHTRTLSVRKEGGREGEREGGDGGTERKITIEVWRGRGGKELGKDGGGEGGREGGREGTNLQHGAVPPALTEKTEEVRCVGDA
jgi:hypothetical protein